MPHKASKKVAVVYCLGTSQSSTKVHVEKSSIMNYSIYDFVDCSVPFVLEMYTEINGKNVTLSVPGQCQSPRRCLNELLQKVVTTLCVFLNQSKQYLSIIFGCAPLYSTYWEIRLYRCH